MEEFDCNEDKWIEILTQWEQYQLIELLKSADEEEKQQLINQVIDLDMKTPGGLNGYCERAKVYLK